MVNHIQGEDYFTTKLQLYQSLQTYEKISITMQKRSTTFLPLNQFVPQTFKLDEKYDRDAFFNIHQRIFTFRLFRGFVFFQILSFILAGDVWICKPSGLNQG
jgi:hypothetical protein